MKLSKKESINSCCKNKTNKNYNCSKLMNVVNKIKSKNKYR